MMELLNAATLPGVSDEDERVTMKQDAAIDDLLLALLRLWRVCLTPNSFVTAEDLAASLAAPSSSVLNWMHEHVAPAAELVGIRLFRWSDILEAASRRYPLPDLIRSHQRESGRSAASARAPADLEHLHVSPVGSTGPETWWSHRQTKQHLRVDGRTLLARMAVRKLRNWWWVDIRHEGTRYRKRSPENSRAGAQAYELVLRQRLAKSEPISGRDADRVVATFAQFAQQWFETYVRANNKPSEQYAKKSVLRTHLVPYFGRTPLSEISNGHIEQFKAKKRLDGLSPKRINNILTILNTCLKAAMDWSVIESVPRIKLLKTTPPQIEFLEPFELQQLLSNQCEPEWQAMITVAARTGMRIGEIVTLMWQDIDFDRSSITVRRSLSANQITATKNYKIRHIPMTVDVKALLASMRQDEGFVFHRPHRQDEYQSRYTAHAALQRACARSHIRRIGWHTLRHTFASHLVMKGVSIYIVQRLLGHSSISQTERYAHLASSTLHEAISVLNQASVDQGQSFGHYLVNIPAEQVTP